MRSMKVSRREFIKIALATSSLIAASAVARDMANIAKIAEAKSERQVLPVKEKHMFSVCFACPSECGVRYRLYEKKDGIFLSRTYGNPYHPLNTMSDPVSTELPPKRVIELQEKGAVRASVCSKAISSPQIVYDPYRIVYPLKRAGPRGSRKWRPISWEQLLNEIANGGKIFSDIGEDREVEGLKNIVRRVDELADEENKDEYLGPKSNQLVFIYGQLGQLREAFVRRFVELCCGSINAIGRTDICQGPWWTAEKLVAGKENLKADLKSVKFLISFGCNYYEAFNPGLNWSGSVIANRIKNGELRLVVVSPYADSSVAHAYKWAPIKPNTDSAFALALAQWIFERKLYNKSYLENTCRYAAEKDKYPSWTNATYLVIVDGEDKGRFLRTGDLGLKPEDKFVVINPATKEPAPHDSIEHGELFFTGELMDVKGERKFKVKTALQLYKESAYSHSLEEWAEITLGDVLDREESIQLIKTIAEEFALNSPLAAAETYRGATSYPWGVYAGVAIFLLNALIGSIYYKGGVVFAAGSHEWARGLYDLRKFDGALEPRGVKISRAQADYTKTKEYKKNRVPKRPWFKFSTEHLLTEAVAGISEKYPYPCKVLITCNVDIVYNTPGGYAFIEKLKDTDKVPLFIAIDTTFNDTNIYADYIIPDVTYLDGQYSISRHEAPICMKVSGILTPAVEPLTAKLADGRPICLETFLIDIARVLGLPGFGEVAIPSLDGKKYPLFRGEDYYLKALANLVYNAYKAGILPPPGAVSPEDVKFVEENYYVARFKESLYDVNVGGAVFTKEEQWALICYALSRGGIFERYETAFDGIVLKNLPEERFIKIWCEELATAKLPVAGLAGTKLVDLVDYAGTATFMRPRAADGKPLADVYKDYKYTVITRKKAIHTNARTRGLYWSYEIAPENFIEVSRKDAEELGIHDGDLIDLISPYGGISGRALITDRVRPGAIMVPHHYGKMVYEDSELAIISGLSEASYILGLKLGIDLERFKGDIVHSHPKRNRGAKTPNYLGHLEKLLNNMPEICPITGSPNFNSIRVNIKKR